MHIAHNALRPTGIAGKKKASSPELQLRMAAYLDTCAKYHREIAAIQKQIPGWTPAFTANL